MSSNALRAKLRKLNQDQGDAIKAKETTEKVTSKFINTLSSFEIQLAVSEINEEIAAHETVIEERERLVSTLKGELVVLRKHCKHEDTEGDSEGNMTSIVCKDCGHSWVNNLSVSHLYH